MWKRGAFLRAMDRARMERTTTPPKSYGIFKQQIAEEVSAHIIDSDETMQDASLTCIPLPFYILSAMHISHDVLQTYKHSKRPG